MIKRRKALHGIIHAREHLATAGSSIALAIGLLDKYISKEAKAIRKADKRKRGSIRL